jgi:hypothetical protein
MRASPASGVPAVIRSNHTRRARIAPIRDHDFVTPNSYL